MLALRLGVFGLKSTGKTVAYSVLYREEEGNDLTLTVRDTASVAYLQPHAEILDRGDVPSATTGAPTQLRWRAVIGDARYELETTDFAGELLEVIGSTEGGDEAVLQAAMNQYKAQVRDWFRQCDAILLFIDCTNSGTVRYRDALVQLLDELAQRPTARGSVRRAIAVVFTKADAVLRDRTDLDNPAVANGLLERHPMYQVVQRRLREYRENVRSRFFLMSALGWNFMTQPNPSRRRVEPGNLFEAFRWAIEQGVAMVEQTHQQMLNDLEQETGKGATERAWLLTDYKELFKRLDLADEQSGLSSGPSAIRFTRLRSRLETGRRNQRWSVAALCLMVALCLLGLMYHLGRQSLVSIYDGYDQVAETHPGESGVRTRLAYYDEQIGSRSRQWFWALHDRKRMADTRAEEDRRLLPVIESEEAFDIWAGEDENRRKSGQHPHRHVAAKAYLDKHWEHARPARVDAVRRVIIDTQLAFDTDAAGWQQAYHLSAETPSECASKVQQLRDYAARTTALRVEEARTLITQVLLNWDKIEYTELQRLSPESTDPSGYDHLESLAHNYLRPNRHSCSMANASNHLLQQIREMRGGKSYSVMVNEVHIPEGSDLHAEFWGYPNCSVILTIAGTSHETKKVKPASKNADGGFTIKFNQTLGPYYVSWGSGTGAVTVITNRSVAANNVAQGSISHPQFILYEFNKPVRINCKAGRTITVSTACGAARLSPLPSFPQ